MRTHPAPRLEADAAIEFDIETVRPYLLASGARFNVSDKVEEAEAFSKGEHGSSLAIPSKLYGTSHVQNALRDLAAARIASGKRWTRTVLSVVPAPENEEGEGVVVLDADSRLALGLIQKKHLAWLLPLIPYGVEVYVSDVTGGPAGGEGFKFYGCNVAFVGVADAIRAMNRAADAAAREAAEEDAHASGNVAKVEATVDAGAPAPAALAPHSA